MNQFNIDDATGQTDQRAGLSDQLDLKPERQKRHRMHLKHASSDALLLASLLEFDNIPRARAQEVQGVIDRHGSLAAVFSTPTDELAAERCIGATGAANLEIACKIMLQSTYAPLRNLPVFANFDYLIRYLLLRMGRDRQEQVRLLSLDIRSRLLNDHKLAEGTATFVHIDTKTVLSQALRHGANTIVLVHNHPSGDAQPSVRDIEFTSEIEAACGVVGIYLADHVIVAGSRWYSFRQNLMIGGVMKSQ